jgi:indole-3-glycerol phosphate synthase
MILDDIVRDNRAELELKIRHQPLAEMRELALCQPAPLDFAAALSGDAVSVIAEIKRASPSAGMIRADFDPGAIARAYAAGGAAAISVLTEPRYFQGNLSYLRMVREALGYGGLPLLRKDFITDAYQIYEARAFRADAVLLIAAILDVGQLAELLALTHELGMTALVEAHDAAELETVVASGARVIGINNRDLKTFTVDLSLTERLRPLVPPDRILVSESGIHLRADVERLAGFGVSAVLVGEALMRREDIAQGLRELL